MISIPESSGVMLALLAFLSGFIETVFPPFPSEGVLITVSFAAARQSFPAAIVIAAASLGSFLSLLGLYALGRGPLRSKIARRLDRWSAPMHARAGRFFVRYGVGAVLVSRFLPVIRGPIAFLAGVYGLRPAGVTAALAVGCLVWNTIIVMIGSRAGSTWDGSGTGLLWIGAAAAGALILLWAVGILIARRMDQNSASSRR